MHVHVPTEARAFQLYHQTSYNTYHIGYDKQLSVTVYILRVKVARKQLSVNWSSPFQFSHGYGHMAFTERTKGGLVGVSKFRNHPSFSLQY